MTLTPLTHLLTSEPALALLGTVFTALWTTFKTSDWRRRAQNRRYSQALRALEAGVEETYRTFVRALKHAREDGKLTPGEMAQARALARDAAIAFGRAQGIDVLRELGADYLDLWIAKFVKRLKK